MSGAETINAPTNITAPIDRSVLDGPNRCNRTGRAAIPAMIPSRNPILIVEKVLARSSGAVFFWTMVWISGFTMDNAVPAATSVPIDHDSVCTMDSAPSRTPAAIKAFRIQIPIERGDEKERNRDERTIPIPRAEISIPNALDPSWRVLFAKMGSRMFRGPVISP